MGTHDQGFEFLLGHLIPLGSEHDLIVQSGHSKTRIQEAKLQQAWFSIEEMKNEIEAADVVIAHMGCGIAREVQVLGAATIFFCRSRERGEHFDNHQLELKNALSGRVGLKFFSEGDDLNQLILSMGDEGPHAPENLEQLVTAVKEWLI